MPREEGKESWYMRKQMPSPVVSMPAAKWSMHSAGAVNSSSSEALLCSLEITEKSDGFGWAAESRT